LWDIDVIAAGIIVSVIGFLVLEAAAAFVYPGGTWWHRQSHGYTFWENYLCDAVQRRAIDGLPNPGAPLAALAMLLLTLGLAAMWTRVPRLFAHRGRGSLARALGLTSAIATLAVIALPGDRFGVWHGVAVVVAGVPGLFASALTVAELLRSDPPVRLAGGFGAAWLLAALVEFLPYSVHLARGTDSSILFPAMQKVALAFLLLWMVSVAVRLARDVDPSRKIRSPMEGRALPGPDICAGP
jgi:hypothetical protein